MNDRQPFHAHIYFDDSERDRARALRETLEQRGDILFAGRLCDGPVGPHPIPQFEIHFYETDVPAIEPLLRASGLRTLIHPLTDDDLADHTALGRWIGEPLDLDHSTLDPPGLNKGIARFGKTDF